MIARFLSHVCSLWCLILVLCCGCSCKDAIAPNAEGDAFADKFVSYASRHSAAEAEQQLLRRDADRLLAAMSDQSREEVIATLRSKFVFEANPSCALRWHMRSRHSHTADGYLFSVYLAQAALDGHEHSVLECKQELDANVRTIADAAFALLNGEPRLALSKLEAISVLEEDDILQLWRGYYRARCFEELGQMSEAYAEAMSTRRVWDRSIFVMVFVEYAAGLAEKSGEMEASTDLYRLLIARMAGAADPSEQRFKSVIEERLRAVNLRRKKQGG